MRLVFEQMVSKKDESLFKSISFYSNRLDRLKAEVIFCKFCSELNIVRRSLRHWLYLLLGRWFQQYVIYLQAELAIY